MNHRAVLVGTSFLPSIGQQLWSDRVSVARALFPCITAALVIPITLARIKPRRRLDPWRSSTDEAARAASKRVGLWADATLVALLAAAFVAPSRGAEQGQVPDILYISALGQLARARWDHNEAVLRLQPGRRTPEPLPSLAPRAGGTPSPNPRRAVATNAARAHNAQAKTTLSDALTAMPPKPPRNIVLMLTESVRAQSTCLDYDETCRFTPFSNRVTPGRLALTQMRAVDSTTAISLAVLWSGLSPTATRTQLHSAPLIWEYAHAAGFDSAYYTSQHLLFANSGTWLEGIPWTRHVNATQLEPDAAYETGADDGALVDFALRDMSHLREPFVVVVHFSNTHYPYRIDERDAPFVPQDDATSEDHEEQLRNRYQDAIYTQDKAVARFVSTMKSRPEGARSVFVFVSDHGEQLREKGAVGHTGSLFEPEIRIPFWIDASDGVLTEPERTNLRALHTTAITSLDVMPTMLDLMGLWEAPALLPFLQRMPGQSLLRPESQKPRAPVVLTNCNELWACAFRNWGAMHGTRKVIAHEGERSWSCFDTALDPQELAPLSDAECTDLASIAESSMRGRPF